MTSPLRRKHPTTARARTTPPPTALEPRADFPAAPGKRRRGWKPAPHWLALLGALVFADLAHAQASFSPVSNSRTYTRQSLGVNDPDAAAEGGPIEKISGTGRPRPIEDEIADFVIPLEPPDPARLFQRESEAALQARIRQESRRKPGAVRVFFPEDPPLTKEKYTPRQFPPLTELVEPGYVMHGRLFFEQRNMERYAWDLGVLSPAASVGGSYKDLALLPYHFWTRPFQQYDSSAGKCLPGDPTPLLLYPPEISFSGLFGEAGAIAAGIAIFP